MVAAQQEFLRARGIVVDSTTVIQQAAVTSLSDSNSECDALCVRSGCCACGYDMPCRRVYACVVTTPMPFTHGSYRLTSCPRPAAIMPACLSACLPTCHNRCPGASTAGCSCQWAQQVSRRGRAEWFLLLLLHTVRTRCSLCWGWRQIRRATSGTT